MGLGPEPIRYKWGNKTPQINGLQKLVTGVIVTTLLMGGLQYFTLLMGVVSPPFKKGPTSQDTIKMLDSDTSLDLFRKRSTALLQFSSHEKVKKVPFLTSIFWRLTGLSTFVGAC